MTTALEQGRARAASESSADSGVLYAVGVFVAVKAGLYAAILLGAQLLPFKGKGEDILRSLDTWDTQHYLRLATDGYGANALSDVFFPLYPMLVRLLTPLFFGNALVSALVVSNAVSLLVPVYLYRLARLNFDADRSLKIVVLLLAFPTAFFLSVAYAEALFLVPCLAAFYYLFKKDAVAASIACFLLPLARAQGLLFLVPVLVLFFQTATDPKAGMREAVRSYLAPAVATVAGVLAYLSFCLWQTGDAFVGFTAQQYFIAGNSVSNLLHPISWFIRNFVELEPELHGFTNSVIDRALFVLALPLLVGVWRTQHRALAVYALVTLLVPALSGSFMSCSRHLLLVFPLFMYMGATLPRPELIAIPMFAIQILFVLMHTGGLWVA